MKTMLAKFSGPLLAMLAVWALAAVAASASQAGDSSNSSQEEQLALMQESLSDLLQELGHIKLEASNRLSTARQNRVASDERIRQTKVSKFILSKTAQLEEESSGLREEINQLYERVKRRQQQQPSNRHLQSAGMFMPVDASEESVGDNSLEARQDGAATGRQQQPESIRRVHEQSIVFIDRLVSNYLANVRRAIDRMTRFVDDRLPGASGASAAAVRRVKRQNSPLWDRIPPRGTELWRDFWDTVRKQVRRINEEFRRISQDMGRLVTGQPRQLRAPGAADDDLDSDNVNRIDGSSRTNDASAQEQLENEQYERINVFDDQDDDFTRSELTRNVALRQQIQQEIGVFGSIFDMMQAFVSRLREAARNMVRDVLDPNGIPNNNNNAVTPGPDIKPQIDMLLEETIEAQRNINSQSKPVLLPNDRDRNLG